jgi:hypothetical protein
MRKRPETFDCQSVLSDTQKDIKKLATQNMSEGQLDKFCEMLEGLTIAPASV